MEWPVKTGLDDRAIVREQNDLLRTLIEDPEHVAYRLERLTPCGDEVIATDLLIERVTQCSDCFINTRDLASLVSRVEPAPEESIGNRLPFEPCHVREGAEAVFRKEASGDSAEVHSDRVEIGHQMMRCISTSSSH
jgi:hypothetical protein